MYTFRDINAAGSDNALPAEAVEINGVQLDVAIPGFRTLYVSGRETLEKEIQKFDSTKASGDVVKYTRYPARVLTVGFQLIAESDTAFRNAFNLLGGYLDCEDVEIIFADEDDKCFFGTPLFNAEPQAGRNAITAEFQIYCKDPFKYALYETEVSSSIAALSKGAQEYDSTSTYEVGDLCLKTTSGVTRLYACKNAITTAKAWSSSDWDQVSQTRLSTNNDGGYITYPRFEVQFAEDVGLDGQVNTRADCGFVQFEKDGYRLQVGDYDEEQLVPSIQYDQNFRSGIGGFVKNSTSNNNALSFKESQLDDDYEATDPVSRSYAYKSTILQNSKGIVPRYGTGTGWHGSGIRNTISTSAENAFSLYWKQLFALSEEPAIARKQEGMFMVLVLGESDEIICGIRLKKDNKKNQKAKLEVFDCTYSGGSSQINIADSWDVDVSYMGKFGFVKSKKTKQIITRASTNWIKRDAEGDITFHLACLKKDYKITWATDFRKAKKVQFFFGQNGSCYTPTENRLLWSKFLNADVGNTFTSGDELIVDANDATIALNNRDRASLGDAGNNWEDFYLDRGANTINVAWSEWVTNGYEPTVKMYYNKRWL